LLSRIDDDSISCMCFADNNSIRHRCHLLSKTDDNSIRRMCFAE